jgi:hypothetical protein
MSSEKMFQLPDDRFARAMVPVDPATGEPASWGGGASTTVAVPLSFTRAYSANGLALTETATPTAGTPTYTRSRTLRTAYAPETWLTLTPWTSSDGSALPDGALLIDGQPLLIDGSPLVVN